MQTVIESSAKPSEHPETPLIWELVLPQVAWEEAAERSIRKGRDDIALFEGTKEHAYQMSLCVITAIYSEYIKLVHFDGELLHIFMHGRMKQNHVVQLKRIFDSKMWLPDKVMNDILATEQARFSIRERRGNDAVETTFLGLESYEGPVDYTDIKDQLVAADITDLTTVCLVYTVKELEESVYHDTSMFALESRIVGGTEKLIDTFMFAQELRKDPIKLKATVAVAERFFQRTKYKATPKLTTQMKLDEARKEAKLAAKPFKTLKKMKEALKATFPKDAEQ